MALSTDDIIEITQLYGRYCHAIDGGDPQGFADCFVADGVLSVGGDPTTGHDELKGFVEMTNAGVPNLRHSASNVVVDPVGDDHDAASGRAHLTAYLSGADYSVIMTGRYADSFVRTADGWKFQRRDFTPDT